jgi:hypothetical protein
MGLNYLKIAPEEDKPTMPSHDPASSIKKLIVDTGILVLAYTVPNFAGDNNNNTIMTIISGIVPGVHCVKEGPVRIQYECLVPIYIISEIKLCTGAASLFPKQNWKFFLTNPTLIYL